MLALTALLASALLALQDSPSQSAPAATATPSTPDQPQAKQDAKGQAAPVKPAAPEKQAAQETKPVAKPARRVKEGSKQSPIVVPTPRPRPPEIPSYRVSLRMKNGRRFMGIVSRDKAFHDLVHSGAHHTDSVYKRADRFTLRFVDGLDGEIELKWSQVSKLEVREILDSAGIRAMESDYFHARVVRNTALEVPAEPAVEAAPEGSVGGEEAPAVPLEGDGDAAKPADDAKKDEPALITEFSPQAGWTPDRKKQIEWRRTVVGAFPDAREQRFLDFYDAWYPQYEKWVKDEQERLEAEAAKSKSDSRSAPRKSDANEPPAAPSPAPKDPPKDPPKESPKDSSKGEGKEGGGSGRA